MKLNERRLKKHPNDMDKVVIYNPYTKQHIPKYLVCDKAQNLTDGEKETLMRELNLERWVLEQEIAEIGNPWGGFSLCREYDHFGRKTYLYAYLNTVTIYEKAKTVYVDNCHDVFISDGTTETVYHPKDSSTYRLFWHDKNGVWMDYPDHRELDYAFFSNRNTHLMWNKELENMILEMLA